MSTELIIHASPNFDERPVGAAIDKVILHYTGMESAKAALEKLCDDSDAAKKTGRVSAHYLIDEDGRVLSLVDERERAWHAGVSYWRGETNLNNTSIGIELVNPGHEFGYRDFPLVQMKALVELLQGIVKRYDIKPHNILGHSDVAPGRKVDPGERFNWRFLARKGVGVWPNVEEIDYPKGQYYTSSPTTLRAALLKFGYNPEMSMDVILRAYNSHYAGSNSPVLSWEAAARLAWLNRNTLPKKV